MPWSIAAGIMWVPISPVVVAPQTKKLPESSQKSFEPAPSRSPASAAPNGLPTAAAATSSSSAP